VNFERSSRGQIDWGRVPLERDIYPQPSDGQVPVRNVRIETHGRPPMGQRISCITQCNTQQYVRWLFMSSPL